MSGAAVAVVALAAQELHEETGEDFSPQFPKAVAHEILASNPQLVPVYHKVFAVDSTWHLLESKESGKKLLLDANYLGLGRAGLK